jgi:hypothetical protein
MKKILLSLITVVILAACSPDPAPPKEPSPYFGEELKLSGDVYTRVINIDPDNPEESILNLLFGSSVLVTYYKAGNVDLTISDGDSGGEGEIKNGKLSYSIGKPNEDYLEPIKNVFDELLSEVGSLPDGVVLPNIDVSSETAQAVPLFLLIEDDSEYVAITRERITSTLTSSSFIITAETVSHLYVDEGVRITVSPFTYETTYPSPGGEFPSDDPPAEIPAGIPVKLTTGSINLNLQEGWNAIHSTFIITLDMLTFEARGNLNIKLGNPSSLYWVLNSVDDESLPLP